MSHVNSMRPTSSMSKRHFNRNSRNMLSAYHAVTLVVYPFLLLVLAMWCQQPIFQLLLLGVTLFALVRSGSVKSWRKTMRYVWPILLLIFVLNVLITKDGSTVLYKGVKLPVFGALRITAEAMGFGAVMVLRMVVVIAAAALYINWLSPDRALGLVARVAGRSAVTAMLTARLIPYLSEQAKSVGDVMQTRGVRFNEGGVRKRLAARRPMMNVLLVSSLEGSWHVAEAMEARGFGQGKRTSYNREQWSRRDLYAWVAMLAAFAVMIWLSLQDLTAYAFYPRLDEVGAVGSLGIGGMVLLNALLLLPPLLVKRRRKIDGTP
jgi:energy-coupling factor transport system permease protein